MKIKELFDVKYGVNLELQTCEAVSGKDSDGVNFVGRISGNNGVVAKVKRISDVVPQAAGSISCAGGGSVLSAFVQTEPYYSGRDLYVLTPRTNISLAEKLYYCMCITANAYKYSYGRQANKTLSDIELPDAIPEWVRTASIKPITTAVKPTTVTLIDSSQWYEFTIGEIFECSTTKAMITTEPGKYPYVTRSAANNGISAYVSDDEYELNKGNCITIGAEGRVAFYQKRPFIAGVKIYTLRHTQLNKHNALFVCAVLNQNLYKYSYGRARILSQIKNEIIKLPFRDNAPDWLYMEQYIKSLPYADRI